MDKNFTEHTIKLILMPTKNACGWCSTYMERGEAPFGREVRWQQVLHKRQTRLPVALQRAILLLLV